MTAAVGVPNWLVEVDEEERRELEALGLVADATREPADQAERDALASRLLRALGYVRRDREGRQAACAKEVLFIQDRYAGDIERLDRRATFLESAIEALALQANFGSKKSRDVGFGTYGRRKVGAKPVVDDEPAAIAWASEHALEVLVLSVKLPFNRAADQYPDLLDEKTTRQSIDKRALDARILSTGEDVPGVRIEPEREEPFAKPQLPEVSR
jgi:hypothetical protein